MWGFSIKHLAAPVWSAFASRPSSSSSCPTSAQKATISPVGFLQPGEQHGGIEAPGVSDHYFHEGALFNGQARRWEPRICRPRRSFAPAVPPPMQELFVRGRRVDALPGLSEPLDQLPRRGLPGGVQHLLKTGDRLLVQGALVRPRPRCKPGTERRRNLLESEGRHGGI